MLTILKLLNMFCSLPNISNKQNSHINLKYYTFFHYYTYIIAYKSSRASCVFACVQDFRGMPRKKNKFKLKDAKFSAMMSLHVKTV